MPTAAVGVVIAIVVFSSGGGGEPVRVKTKTNTVTTKAKAKPATAAEPAALTGAALGTDLNEQGFSLLEQGSYEDAIGVLQRAVEAFPDGWTDVNNAYALYNLARALRLAGQPEDAIPLLQQRLRLTNDQRGVVSKSWRAQSRTPVRAPAAGPEHPVPTAKKAAAKGDRVVRARRRRRRDRIPRGPRRRTAAASGPASR